MTSSSVLVFKDLQAITGYTRRSDVERSLRSQGIRVFLGKDGPWTTIDLINNAGGISPGTPANDTYDPEAVL